MSLSDFIEKSNLPIYDSHEKGDPCKFKKRPPKNDYGFQCSVSDKEFDDFEGQVTDAIAFLENHLDELKELVSQYDIDDIRLDFPIECRLIKNNLFSQCDYESMKRYVRKVETSEAVPFRRMEALPGTECQVDYGAGAWIVGADGKRIHGTTRRQVQKMFEEERPHLRALPPDLFPAFHEERVKERVGTLF
jgi:hypothetical protein